MVTRAAEAPGFAQAWRRRLPPLPSVAAIPVVIAVWEVVSATSVVPATVLPGPAAIAAQFVHLASSGAHYGLEQDAAATLERLLIGTLIATVVGIPAGVALGAHRRLRAIAQPAVLLGLTLPALALTPLYMVFFGIGQLVTLAVVTIEALVPIAVTVATGYRSIPVNLLWVSKALGARRLMYWRAVALPALAAPIVTGLRIGMGYAWRSLVAVEGITALKFGIGYRTFQAGQYFDTSTIYAEIIVVAILGIVLETIILGRFERMTVVRWGVAKS